MRCPLFSFRFWLLLVVYLICSLSTSGKPQTLFGELYTSESGLSHSGVTAILQDSLGFLWVGTRDGLNKYDGYSFEHFRYQPDTVSLSSNSIRCITEGREGILWIGTDNGLNKLDRLRGYQWSHFLPAKEHSIPGRDNIIHDVIEDEEGIVWVRSDRGILRLDPVNGNLMDHAILQDSAGPSECPFRFTMLRDSTGRIWTDCRNGLISLDPRNGHISRHFIPADSPGVNRKVNSLLIDRNGKIWLGTREGLIGFEGPGGNLFEAAVKPGALEEMDVSSLGETAGGSILVGTRNGYMEMDTCMENVRRFEGFYIQEIYTGFSNVRCFYEDASSILWIGTDEGLVKIDRKARKFNRVSSLTPVIKGLSSYTIRSIYKTQDGDLWLGTAGRGLNRIREGTDSALVYDSRKLVQRISHDHVYAIHQDRSGNIWIGTGSGVDVMESGSYVFSSLCELFPSFSCELFRGQNVYDIIGDKSGRLWFATSAGVCLLEPATGKTSFYRTILSGRGRLDLQDVYCLLEDREGRIWIGSSVGLVRYIPELDRFDFYQAGISDLHANINSNVVYCLMQDTKDRLWIGTSSGLNRYDAARDRFEYFPDPVELSEMRIFSILEDHNGKLWLGSDRGLTKYDPEIETIIAYGHSDGVLNGAYYPGAGFKDANGTMYFGGISGLNFFHPDSIRYNPHIPPLSFTQFFRIREQGGYSRPLALDRVSKVIVPKGVEIISIRFSALDFTLPQRNRYIYRLVRKGQDGLWIHNSEQHHLTFYKLAPGTYTLSVKGSNNDLLYNDREINLEIVIPHSFWGKGLAIGMYVIAGIILLFASVQFGTRNLRRANRMLRDKEVAAREISRQREELAVKNKNITDSINYARRIQVTLLPAPESFKALLPDSFVLFKPKDIVSGDIYWINQHGSKVFVAAVDCTGHGVPGAFVSIIGFELFRDITTSEKGVNPAMILDHLNNHFTDIFSNGEQVHLKDGMDLSLCVIDKEAKSLDYAGAFNPLYLIRNETIIEVKADRFSVGADVHTASSHRLFRNHKIDLEPEDIIYMFSDGYADQFGGPEGKKFKYRRFRHLLLTIHKLPMEEQRSILDESISEWMGDMEQIDDILVIGIRPGVL